MSKGRWWDHEDTLTGFERTRDRWIRRMGRSAPYSYVAAVRMLQQGESCLEVGCDVGALMAYMREYCPGSFYVGMDLIEAYVASAVRYFKEESFVCGNAVGLPFVDNAFDQTCCFDLFVSLPAWRDALLEMVRVSRRRALITSRFTNAGPTVEDARTAYQEVVGMRNPVIVKNVVEFEAFLSHIPKIEKVFAHFSEDQPAPHGMTHPFVTDENILFGFYSLELKDEPAEEKQ